MGAALGKLNFTSSDTTKKAIHLDENFEGSDVRHEIQVWYRHSGEAEIDQLPSEPRFKRMKNEKEILDNIGENRVTHMHIRSGRIALLDQIAPHLTHLKVETPVGPSSFQRLSHLKVLDLSLVNLSEGLPPSVCQLTSLRELKLRCCELTQLPQQLASLEQLQLLDVSGNKFSKGIPEVISQLSSLRTLSLAGCEITELPKLVGSFHLLETLDLSDNNLSSGFPDKLASMTSLRTLSLAACQISDLPNGLANLTQLKDIDLSNNMFSGGLPPVITQLTSLNKLTLRYCRLTRLHRGLANLNKLQDLDLSSNMFADGLPLVVTKLTSLAELALKNCQLMELPARFTNLQGLHALSLSQNAFTEIPPPVYKLNKLQQLNVSSNAELTRIEKTILQLANLRELNCDDCDSLRYPPKAVCSQGLHAVQEYFVVLSQSAEIMWSPLLVAVVGSSLSGKTSLIRSLQFLQRQLTFRDETSPLDETTRMFKMEDLHFDKFSVKFVDYGGQDVYHVAYNIAKKDHCLPMVVINMKEFKELADTKGDREATQRLLFNWLAHLYVASPHLGPPILVLTHADQLTPAEHEQCKMDLLRATEEIRKVILEEERQLSISSPPVFQNIDHFKQTDLPLIQASDVFEFDDDLRKTDNILKLRSNLEQRCIALSTVIPEQWDIVAKFLENADEVYLTLSDVQEKFEMEGLEVVLGYLHNCGAILWFGNDPRLSGYVFHNIPAIVDMIALLFHHSADEQWKESIENYKAFFHNGESIEKDRYKYMVEQFTQSGLMAEALLVHFLRKHKLPDKIALDLLQAFYIVHGPMMHMRAPQYAIPSIAKSVMPTGWESDGRLQLRLDMLFKGLSPPKYVFHLITVAVLKFAAGPRSVVDIWRNGATVRCGEYAIHLFHDYTSMKVTLQVSTSVNKLGMSWKKLLETTAHVNTMLQRTWPASRVLTQVYCAHCLFLGEQTPSCDVHPDWLYSRGVIDVNNIQTFSGVVLVACKRTRNKGNRLVPTVPSPLVLPCYDLTDGDIVALERYLSTLVSARAAHVDKGFTSIPATTSTGSLKQLSFKFDGSSDSDVSDFEDDRILGGESLGKVSLIDSDDSGTDDEMPVKLKPVTKFAIKRLYKNCPEVYNMSDNIRGRALILNITSNDENDAHLQLDSHVFRRLFFNLAFHTEIQRIATVKSLTNVLKQETSSPHHRKYGMFVVVILGHGEVDGYLCDKDEQILTWSDIFNQLASQQFPAMADKPKLILAQSYSAGTKKPSAQNLSGRLPGLMQRTAEVPKDLVFLKTQREPCPTSKPQNSLFVRVLEATINKHSCHRDLLNLLKIVRQRLELATMQMPSQMLAGNSSLTTTSTYTKRLFFFPGFNVEDDETDPSDSSDDSDEENKAAHISTVTKQTVKEMFTSDEVYRMSAPVRGRCLIINNRQFEKPTTRSQAELPDRPGSEVDVKNLKGVFQQLSFEVLEHHDLSGQEMLRVIEEETHHPDHGSYGMFVLVIMTHGNETQLAGSDGRYVNLLEVYGLTSPTQFKTMAGKPKWLILQACSEVLSDMVSSGMEMHPPTSEPVDSQQSTLPLSTDDLFIMRSSFQGYVSERHLQHGSWFVTALVKALYKHSCYRDIQTLFERQVMKKVIAKSISYHRKNRQTGYGEPNLLCYPTKNRKLYLFPGYKGP